MSRLAEALKQGSDSREILLAYHRPRLRIARTFPIGNGDGTDLVLLVSRASGNSQATSSLAAIGAAGLILDKVPIREVLSLSRPF